MSQSIPSASLADAHSTAKILVVEDDETNKILVQEILELTEFHADFASNGQECIDKVDQYDYDLILMDIQMPVMDGIQATRNIRLKKRYENVPIVAVTANSVQDEIEHYYAVGMNDCVSKPIVLNTLLSVIEKWIGKPSGAKKAQNHDGEERQIISIPLAGMDVNSALANLGGDVKTYLEIVGVFKDAHSNDAFLLEQALQKKDFKQARFILHSLRGLLGTIGIVGVLDSVMQLHQSIHAGDAIDDALLKQFKDTYNERIASLDILLEYANMDTQNLTEAQELGEVSLQDLSPKIDKLKTLLGLFETDSELLANEILKETNSQSLRDLLSEVLVLIKKFDFEEALIRLEQFPINSQH